MIHRQEILDRAGEWQLRPDVVEKDYVIGWLLWAIARHPVLGQKWVFKGGTCLKKCFLETYRFSEDIDFTVLPDGPSRAADVQPHFTEVLTGLASAVGIDFASQPPRFRDLPGGINAEGKIYYRGPLGAPVASIKVDVSGNETVVQPPVLRPITHTYPDVLPLPAQIRCYSFEELFAEKLRALGERCRPRDLYDVVNLFRREDLRTAPNLIRTVLEQKCRSKGVPVPAFESVLNSPFRSELESEWENMLGHQLPALPPLESFRSDLEPLFGWLEGRPAPETLPAISVPGGADDTSWQPPPSVWQWGQGVPLESVRFAGANHLCVDLGYNSSIRRIEPYSLRRSREGNLLLYGRKVQTGEIRAYRVDRITSIQVTTQPFIPRYRVEFTPSGGISAPPVSTGIRLPNPFAEPRRSRRSRPVGGGPRYVCQCPYCQKQFRRSRMNSRLNPHKDRLGYNCRGRSGQLLRTE